MSQTPDRPVPAADIPFDHQPAKAPFIENAALPAMGPVTAIPANVARATAGALMAETPGPDAGGTGRMEPVPIPAHGLPLGAEGLAGRLGGVVARGPAVHPDQQAKPAGPDAAAKPSEGYVRLRVRAEGTTLSVVGAKEVGGPLVTSNRVGSGLVYEVTSGGRRISLEQLPDGGAQRSFTNIDRPEASLGHHFTPLTAYEFAVRVPRSELTAGSLPNLEIALHRIAGPLETPLTADPLPKQPGATVTEVAKLSGIALNALEPTPQAELTRILQSPNPST